MTPCNISIPLLIVLMTCRMLQKEMFLGLQRGKMSRCNSQRGCSWVLGRQMVISQTPLHLNNLIDLTLRYINVWYKVCPFEFLYKENNLMRLVFFKHFKFYKVQRLQNVLVLMSWKSPYIVKNFKHSEIIFRVNEDWQW